MSIVCNRVVIDEYKYTTVFNGRQYVRPNLLRNNKFAQQQRSPRNIHFSKVRNRKLGAYHFDRNKLLPTVARPYTETYTKSCDQT